MMDYSKLTIKQLRNEIARLNLKSRLPQEGSGSRGNLIKRDYIETLENKQKEMQRKGKNYKKYTKLELERKIEQMGLNPYGSRYSKADLIKIIKDQEEKEKTVYLQKQKPVGTEFLSKMPPEVARLSLKKLDLNDILNFCYTSKGMNERVCTEHFWKEIAQERLNLKIKANFPSWFALVKAMKFGMNDLVSIYNGYKYGLYTKTEAQNKINALIENNKLTNGGYNGVEAIKLATEDYLEMKFRDLYGQPYSNISRTNAVESVVAENYSIFYDSEIRVDYANKPYLVLAYTGSNNWIIDDAKKQFESENTDNYAGSYSPYYSSEESSEEF